MAKNFYKKVLAALTILALLFFLNNYFTNHIIQRWTIGLLQKPLSFSYANLGSLKLRLTSWFRVDNITSENQTLRQENRSLFSVNLKIAELEKENDFLRQELGIAQRRKWQLEMAKIFQLNTSGSFRTALIDKGGAQGVRIGMPVIFQGEILLGIVKEVFDNNALVYLINDSRVALNIKSQDSKVSGRARGALEQGLFLELVTNQEEIVGGETILTSGLDGLPASLIVGQVADVKEKTGELFKTVRVEPQFETLPLENIFVIKS